MPNWLTRLFAFSRPPAGMLTLQAIRDDKLNQLVSVMPQPTNGVLNKTDIARVFRQVYGNPRYGSTEFADAIARAVVQRLEALDNTLNY